MARTDVVGSNPHIVPRDAVCDRQDILMKMHSPFRIPGTARSVRQNGDVIPPGRLRVDASRGRRHQLTDMQIPGAALPSEQDILQCWHTRTHAFHIRQEPTIDDGGPDLRVQEDLLELALAEQRHGCHGNRAEVEDRQPADDEIGGVGQAQKYPIPFPDPAGGQNTRQSPHLPVQLSVRHPLGAEVNRDLVAEPGLQVASDEFVGGVQRARIREASSDKVPLRPEFHGRENLFALGTGHGHLPEGKAPSTLT